MDKNTYTVAEVFKKNKEGLFSPGTDVLVTINNDTVIMGKIIFLDSKNQNITVAHNENVRTLSNNIQEFFLDLKIKLDTFPFKYAFDLDFSDTIQLCQIGKCYCGEKAMINLYNVLCTNKKCEFSYDLLSQRY